MDVEVIPSSNPYAWLRLTAAGLRKVLEANCSDGERAETWIEHRVAGARQGDTLRFPMTSTKTSKTAVQRKAERDALLASLGEKVAALTSSEEWIAYLRFVAAFGSYSFNNVCLIAAQCPQATHVAGYRAWQQLDRQVRKGEKAMKILGYSTKKITRTDPEAGEEIEDRVARYPVLSVFDLPDRRRPGPHRRLPAAHRRGTRRCARSAHGVADRAGLDAVRAPFGRRPRGIHRPRAAHHHHRGRP